MNRPYFRFFVKDSECWSDKKYFFAEGFPPIRVRYNTGGPEPDNECCDRVMTALSPGYALILSAASQILHNYSYAHFKKLRIPASRLVKEETPDAIAKAIRLYFASFSHRTPNEFELSFYVSWDQHHSYDVRFQDGKAIYCGVNG